MSFLNYDLSIVQDDTADTARSALDRIRRKREVVIENKTNAEFISKQNREREFMIEFEESAMDTKIKSDTYFYGVLFSRLDDSIEESKIAVDQMISAQIAFYETLNISPVFNHLSEYDLVNNTESKNTAIAESVISAYMKTHLFCLTQEQREIKYKDKVVPLAESYVVDFSADHNTAVDLAYKTIVAENLIKHVHNSIYVNLYYEDCLKSEQYNQFFDVPALQESYKLYNESVLKVAQLVAISL